jgi:twinkle protein
VLIPNDLILEAKEKLGSDAALIIANDLQLQEFDEKNLKSLCPFHNENTPSFIWNQKDNYFHCFSCGKIYGILDHYMSFYCLTFLGAVQKLFEQTGIKFAFGEKDVKTKRDYKYPRYQLDENRDLVEKYFSLRKISKETLDYCDVQQGNNGLIMWNFYNENDVLMTVKCRYPRKPKKGENKEWYLPNYDNTPILFNMNKIDPTQPLIISEGQIDLLSIIEAGYKNVVSIPGGTENSKWIEFCYDWLERFEKIILWFDSDTPGVNARKEAAARLGSWRTLFVDMPYDEYEIDGIKRPLKDANDVLITSGKEKIIDLIENANEIPIENIIDLADVPDFDIETAPGLYSPFEELNKYINKFVFGTVVIVTGRNGSGKSSLLNQMFIAEPLNQGYDAFVYSAEMSKPILKSWLELVLMDRQYLELKNNTVHKFTNKEAIQDMRNWYKNRVFVYDNDKDLSANSILDRLESVVRKFGVKVALLDNLLSIDLGNTNQENLWQEQKKFMVRLINFANKYNILITLVAHPRKTAELRRLTSDDVGGSGDITNLAHYVLGIHRYSKSEREGEKDGKGNYKKGKKPILFDCVVDLFKNRLTGHANKSIELYFDYLGYKFYRTPAQLWKRYKWNKDNTPLPTNDPNDHEEIPDDFKD